MLLKVLMKTKNEIQTVILFLSCVLRVWIITENKLQTEILFLSGVVKSLEDYGECNSDCIGKFFFLSLPTL